VKLSSDFFTADSITLSKKLIFDCMNPSEQRYIKRKGENRSKEDSMDICTLMLAAEINTLPEFLAKDITNLPPLSVGDFDMSRMLREIEGMKCTISALAQSQSSLVDIVQALSSNHKSTNIASCEDQTHISAGNSLSTETFVAESVKTSTDICTKEECVIAKATTVVDQNNNMSCEEMSSSYLTLDFTTGSDDVELDNSPVTDYNIPVKNAFSVLMNQRPKVVQNNQVTSSTKHPKI
jgi:hypothetical protein